jgi:hypothetical protein
MGNPKFRFTLSHNPTLQFANYDFNALTNWEQITPAGHQAFSYDQVTGSALSDGSSSNLANTGYLGQTRQGGWPVGTYTIEIAATNLSSGGSSPYVSGLVVQGSNDGVSLATSIAYSGDGSWTAGGFATKTITFTTTQVWPYLFFGFTKQGPSTGYEIYFAVRYIQINSTTDTNDIKVISEPDGWKDAVLKLERHPDFHSLVEYFEGGFIFYGSNGNKDGGLDFIKSHEAAYGVDVTIEILIELSFNEGLSYVTVFDGLLDISEIQELPDNKIEVPIIRDDLWVKFINRRDTPVSLSSTTDLDGNPVAPVDPIDINLPSQPVRQSYIAHLDRTAGYPGLPGVEITDNNTYVQFDWNIASLSEIAEKFTLPIIDNPGIPVPLFSFKYAGRYVINITIDISDDALEGSGPSFAPSTYLNIFFQLNNDTRIVFTKTNVPVGIGALRTRYTFSTTLSIHDPGAEIRIYGERSNTDEFYIMYQKFDSVNGIEVYNNISIIADTTYESTEAQGYFLHDVFAGIIERIVGRNAFYSTVLGRTDTNLRQYDANGCYSAFVILKGLQLRGYTLTEKPFFISFNQAWKIADPIFNLGLGYNQISGVDIIELEKKSDFYDKDNISVSISNTQPTREYDNNRIFKKINIGYSQWESEDVSGMDDPHAKQVRATAIAKTGVEFSAHCEGIAASIAIETTIRQRQEKTKDYKFDNNNFIIHLYSDDLSPDRYRPEFSENFNSISNLNNSDQRYNLILTPLRNFLRWANYFNGCLQKYLTSSYRFVSGEGNYDMESDYNCATGQSCLGIICDNLAEDSDISLSVYGPGIGFIHLPDLFTLNTKLNWENYLSIRTNRKYAISFSQTTSNHKKLLIDKLEYTLCRSKVKIVGWAGEQIDLTVPLSLQPASVMCSSPVINSAAPIEYDESYQDILDRATTLGYSLPSEEQKVKQNNFVIALKNLGIWDDLDILYVFATDGDSDFATLNWKAPASFQASKVSSPTFTANQGFTGNGSSAYLDTGWAPDPDGVNYTQNDACGFVYVNNSIAESQKYAYGALNNTPSAFGLTAIIPYAPTNTYGAYVNGFGVSGANSNSKGFYSAHRNGGQITGYKNAVQIATAAIVSNGLTTNDVAVLAGRGDAGAASHSSYQVGVFGMGANISESSLYTAWNDYFTSL